VDGFVDRLAAGLEHVAVLVAKAVEEPEIGDAGLLLDLADRGLLEFFAPFDAAFGELPVPGAALEEQVLAAAPRIPEEDSPRARRFDCHCSPYDRGGYRD
jgi:hypothetical protein